ncbi:MAG: von Willebrand factor type A domain-containing protein [Litoreibacter sp.]|nr:von Willebrand factor type A domain-containing protein [Litoreibacter sp.]
MSDEELNKLRRLLQDAPAPDTARKEAALRAAEESFAAFQESPPPARPTETAPERRGVLEGLLNMFANNSLRPAMLATSSLVIVGVGVALYQYDPKALTGPVGTSADEVAVLAEPLILESAPAPAVQSRAKSAELGAVTSFASDQAQILPMPTEPFVIEEESRDRFVNEDPNPLKITAEDPVSTFSTDVDTASYAWVRRSLQNGALPAPEAVRVEEMINYFPYDYAAPEGEAPFATQVSVSETPWNAGTKLVQIGLQGALPEVADRPPLNLVFLIDTSGSMQSADKLPLLIQSFRLMLGELRDEDQVAIVTYAGSAGVALEPTAAGDRRAIEAALTNLTAGGSTAGAAGLEQAYALAEEMTEDGDISRVLLATDGDFNVGLSSDDEMKTLIEAKRDSGTYLSVLGFGRGNLNDALMQTLAQNGNGQAAYIDTLAEAHKVLVDQLTGALFPIAGDVKVQVEWNPAQIAEYRLIGYETRALKREDFNNDKIDAGDIGAGLQVTALYEVAPVGSPAVLNDALRYGTAAEVSGSDELGFLRLRYKAPGEDVSQLIEQPITGSEGADAEAGFATAIAGFGQLLRGSDYLGDWSYADAIRLANISKGADPFGYRAEAITLMRLAESLAKGR